MNQEINTLVFDGNVVAKNDKIETLAQPTQPADNQPTTSRQPGESKPAESKPAK